MRIRVNIQRIEVVIILMEVFSWTIADYQEAILNAMKPDYEWYTPDMLRKIDKVTIAKIRDLVESRRAPDEDDCWRKDPLNTPAEVVDAVCQDIRQQIEWHPSSYLRKVREYCVPFLPQELGGGWMLEDYRFTKYEGGVFFSSVTAGDRSSGAGRTFYIPGRIIKGHTYEEFLDAYFDEIADPRAFGLGKEALLFDGILKAFLGFTERKAHPEVNEVRLPDLTVCSRYEYCRGDNAEHIKENGPDGSPDLITKEWLAFAKHLPEVADCAVRDDRGAIPCYWGIMTDDNVFRDDITFCSPWTHYFRTGYYLAALEVSGSSPKQCLPGEWIRHVLPARSYVVADATDATPAQYDELLRNYINCILPEMGYTLSGAILERIEPAGNSLQLYFPVEPLS